MVIKEIAKNAREIFRISIEEYRGHRFIDCRVYFTDDQGAMRPTKKGIALNDEIISDVMEGLRIAKKQLEMG